MFSDCDVALGSDDCIFVLLLWVWAIEYGQIMTP